jgi:hypothetical protein
MDTLESTTTAAAVKIDPIFQVFGQLPFLSYYYRFAANWDRIITGISTATKYKTLQQID